MGRFRVSGVVPHPYSRGIRLNHPGSRRHDKLYKLCYSGFLSAIVFSSAIEAKTVLSHKERCFAANDGFESIKIKPQQALTDKEGGIIPIVGLVQGRLKLNLFIAYNQQFAGAASYIQLNNGQEQITDNITQVALVGTGYGTDTGFASGVYGLWSFSYSLMLEPEKMGKIASARLVGTKSFKGIGNGHDADSEIKILVDEKVTEFSCRNFR
jgi:hypothetical protein